MDPKQKQARLAALEGMRKGPELSQGYDVPLDRQNPGENVYAMKDGVEEDGGIEDLITMLSPVGAGKAALAAAPLVGAVAKYGDDAVKAAPKIAKAAAAPLVGAVAKYGDDAVKAAPKIAKAADAGLDMSKAARMARAKDLGFDTGKTFYHGTPAPNDFSAFETVRSRDGIAGFFSPDPYFANKFAAVEGLENSRVIPVHLRTHNIFDYENPEHIEKLRATIQEYIDNAEHVVRSNRYGGIRSLDDILPYIQKGDWQALEMPFVSQSIKKAGFNGMHVAEGGTKNTAIFNPKDIRSTFAAFDPAKKDSANILAGGVGAALLAGGAAPNEASAMDDNQKKFEDDELARVLAAMGRPEPELSEAPANAHEWRQQPPLWKSGPADTYETEPGLEQPFVDPIDLLTAPVNVGGAAGKAAVAAANSRPGALPSITPEAPSEQKQRLAALRDMAAPEPEIPSLFDHELKGEAVPAGPDKATVAKHDPTPVRPVDLTRTEPYTPAELKAAEILKKEESFVPKAFVDRTRPRIGYSTEEYENGKPVKLGDTVSEEKAYDMMMNRIGRDRRLTEKFKSKAPLLKDPNVEAVTLSRMYHQGPGNVLPVNSDPDKNRRLALYKALKSGKKTSFANAVKNASPDPSFKGRLTRESHTVLGDLIRKLSGKK